MGHISFREYPTFDFIAPDRCIVKARAQLLPISLGGGIHVMRIGIQLAPFLNTKRAFLDRLEKFLAFQKTDPSASGDWIVGAQ